MVCVKRGAFFVNVPGPLESNYVREIFREGAGRGVREVLRGYQPTKVLGPNAGLDLTGFVK